MQEFTVEAEENFCLNLLRKKYREAGMSGQCIVRFHDCHEDEAFDLPQFLRVHQYSFTKPAHEMEIGGCEFFHLVPINPLSDFIR